MRNTYEIRGRVTAIIINSRKYGRQETLISTDTFERIMEFPNSWYVKWSKCTNSFYVQANMVRENGKKSMVFLHRWITNAPNGMVVDHINHNTLDNTVDNLRVVTHLENARNRKGAQRNNKTSGIRGVSWHKKTKKWRVQISFNGRRITKGYFNELFAAERVAIELREGVEQHVV